MDAYLYPLDQLLNEISIYRPERVQKDELDARVKSMLAGMSSTSRQQEVVRAEWESAVKTRILDVAAREGEAALESYYATLYDLLDVVLTLAEQDACEVASPLHVFQDLLDTQTIPSCEILCQWLELRVARLTRHIHVSAVSLGFLRTLNDILRRLSKSSHAFFCGRIMQLLASKIFLVGERSGVNLRGAFNTANKTLFDEDSENELYTAFWSLQQYFSNPPAISSTETTGMSMAQFRVLVEKVLPTIQEATEKEKQMTGTKETEPLAGKKRKFGEMMDVDGVSMRKEEANFFPKFLTKEELLDYEFDDTAFRRTILLQLEIFLNHLTFYTPPQKAKWYSKNNVSLQMSYDLVAEDEIWVKSTRGRVVELLRNTMPGGRVVAAASLLVMQREKNWIDWKNQFCNAIEKPALPDVEVSIRRAELNRIAAENRISGTESGLVSLLNAWEWGYSGVEDLERPLELPTPKDLLPRYQMAQKRIDQRNQQIAAVKRQQEARLKAAQEAKSKAAAEALAREKAKQAQQEQAKAEAKEQPITTGAATDLAVVPTTDAVAKSASPAPAALPVTVPSTPSMKPPALEAIARISPAPGESAKPALLKPATAGASTPGTPGAEKANPMNVLKREKLEPIAPLPTDSIILQAEQQKASLNWRALRLASRTHLHLFKEPGIGELPNLTHSMEHGTTDTGKV